MIFYGPSPIRRDTDGPESLVDFDRLEADVRDAEPWDLELPDPSEYAGAGDTA